MRSPGVAGKGGRMDLVVEDAHSSGCRWVPSQSAGRRVAAGAVLALTLASPARAYFLDSGRDFDLRARLYTEGALAVEDSQPQTKPARAPFQLIESRTFFNPEFDAKLTRYQPFHLDDFSFRLALWGFYDGIYQYGPSQYD